jgi:uncharacterized protein YbaA (DUF1428 family)
MGKRRRDQADQRRYRTISRISDAAELSPFTAIIPVSSWKGRQMEYVDGFIVPVPKKKMAAYRALARKAGKIWREYGALDYRECIAEDVKVGKLTSFPRSVKLKPQEVVVFSWIVYKSRAHRDRVNAKVMKDPRLAGMNPKTMPFDAKRLIYGGFETFVKLKG